MDNAQSHETETLRRIKNVFDKFYLTGQIGLYKLTSSMELKDVDLTRRNGLDGQCAESRDGDSVKKKAEKSPPRKSIYPLSNY